MSSPRHSDLIASIGRGDATSAVGEDHDAFLRFVEYARSMLWSPEEEEEEEGQQQHESDGGCGELQGPPWSWIVSRVLKTCLAYPSGVTSAILLSDLSQAWSEQNRHAFSKREVERMIPFKKRHRRKRLQNTVTIDSIFEKNFLSTNSNLEAVVLDAFVLPGTNIYMLSLGDKWSSCAIELYLHRRYYELVDLDRGILRKGREIFLTGCCLRTAMEGYGHPRLLPTEYMVILLDEDQDEDAMLLGAQFCSDSFSSISLDAFKNGSSYAFYARIESIGPLEVQGAFGSLQRKQITLTDNDGVKIKFLLWGEQVLLANCFSAGSMLAVDRPFIASAIESNIETCEMFCLEYGSATQLYLVPFIQQEEPVLLTSTQMRNQGSKLLNATNQSQCLKISQVSLPLDYEGSIDFKNYPFRSYITDLRDKMTGICLYGAIRNIYREVNNSETVYAVTIEDITGVIRAKLHFVRSWSLGRVGLGHIIYISGLTCSMTIKKQLEASWFEKDPGTSLINLSCLPALLNSSCLHKLSDLSHLSTDITSTHICHVRLEQIEHHCVNSTLLHTLCGHFVDESADGIWACRLCSSTCADDVIRSFHLKVILADDSAKISAWSTGPTAAEMLLISPDEFYELPGDEQAMYLYTLENEEYIVALVSRNRQTNGDFNNKDQEPESVWEIVHVQKYE